MEKSEEVKKLISSKEYEQAVAKLNNLLKENPNEGSWLILRGNVFYLQQKFAKALNDYRKAIKSSPENKILASKIEMIKEILKFQAWDIYASTNLNSDPWLED
ncbi:MAG: tetratricopeptide repeat protein [Bacteroidales bacterium]|nr:tetratricopeptide repeat protein [Bacteroidales bacterium]